MIRFIFRHGWAVLWLSGFGCLGQVGAAPTIGFRGLWVDAAHPGFKSPAEVTRLIRDARAIRVNALLVEVRRNGETFYPSELEPRAAEGGKGYDPMAEVLRQARDTTSGPRLEVHAWIDTLPAWNLREPAPSDARHVFRQHPDWLTLHSNGTNFGSAYVLDPGHPGVSDHLVAVAVDLVSRYDVDGLYLDQLRYPSERLGSSNGWGYNPVSLARFQRLLKTSRRPAAGEALWSQFRRDQVTALARRMALEVGRRRPGIRVSAACVAEAYGVSPIAWESTAAFGHAFQDWRAWLREGFLDTAVPRMYFDAQINLRDWQDWSEFLSANRFNRQIVVGLGAQMNRLADTLTLARSVDALTGLPRGLDGQAWFSYAAPAADQSQQVVFTSLRQANSFETNRVPLFSQYAKIPPMPWKSHPGRGQLLGRAQQKEIGMDGARVELKGRAARSFTADANGWFGAADLLAGDYLIRVRPAETNRVTLVGWMTVTNGATVRPEFLMADADPDHDGYDNDTEFLAGTDPRDINSHLAVDVMVLPDRLSLRARPFLTDRRYVLETASSSIGPWVALTDSVSLDGSEGTAPLPSRETFFRVRVSY